MSVQFYRVGGIATDNPSDIVNLWAKVATSGQVSTFRKAGTTSGYATTTGKQFYVSHITITIGDNLGSNYGVAFGYADNDVGMDTTTARTNPVALRGDPEQTSVSSLGGTAFDGLGGLLVGSEGATSTSDSIWKGAPSQKYLYMKCIGTSIPGSGVCVILSGFEA